MKSYRLFALFLALCMFPIAIVYAMEISGNIQDLTYTYDNVGNITNILDDSITATNKTVDYGYDDLNRLTTAASSGLVHGDYNMTYGYDPVGNMTYKSDIGTMSYTGTGLPTPHAVTDVAGTPYTYDLNGNLTSDGLNTYTWTIRNELESATTPSGTFTFTYDPSGQRVSMIDPDGEETIYVNPLFEIRPDSTIYNIFTGSTRIASMEVGEGSHPLSALLTYFHQDHLGGTQLTSDEFGRVTQVYDYLPYGSQALSENLGNNEANHSFTDKEFHEDLGLYYFEARYYNPVIGRFVSLDPYLKRISLNFPNNSMRSNISFISDPQNWNDYAYAKNNPVRNIDPTGLDPTESDIKRSIHHPFQGIRAWRAKGRAEKATNSRFSGSTHNNLADAYRHTYWSAELTKILGPEAAYEITTAHEIESGNSAEETEMDMHNNQVGITLALDPHYQDFTVDQLLEIAMGLGLLQSQTNDSTDNSFIPPQSYSAPPTDSEQQVELGEYREEWDNS